VNAPARTGPVRRAARDARGDISGIDTEADLATEMLGLHPDGYDGPSRIGV